MVCSSVCSFDNSVSGLFKIFFYSAIMQIGLEDIYDYTNHHTQRSIFKQVLMRHV